MAATDLHRSRREAERLQWCILRYVVGGILVVGLAIGLVGVLPFYLGLKADAAQQLEHHLHTRALVVEQYVASKQQIALQVTSRTQIRVHLEAYNRGEVSRDEVTAFQVPRLYDAIDQSADAIGLVRLDAHGEAVVEIGQTLSAEHWPWPADGSSRLAGPFLHEGQPRLAVAAAIMGEGGRRAGTDILFFDASPLQRMIAEHSHVHPSVEVLLGSGVATHPLVPFASRTGLPVSADDPLMVALSLALAGESGSGEGRWHETPTVLAWRPVQAAPWALVAKVDAGELYAPVHRLALMVGGVVLLFIIGGAWTTTIILRPLAGRVILHTDELQREINERTEALQHELRRRRNAEEQLRNHERELERTVEQRTAELRRLAGQERLSRHMATNLLDATGDRFDAEVSHALARLGELMQVDRIYLFRATSDGLIRNTHEWNGEGVVGQANRLQRIEAAECCPWTFARLRAGESVRIDDVAAMGEAAAIDRAFFQSLGLQSLLLVPMCGGDTLRGFIGLDATRRPIRWQPSHTETLQVVAHIFHAAFERRLIEAELEQARVQAQAANEAKSAFLASVSHEIRNPMNAILGMGELLAADGGLEAEQRRYVDLINRAAGDLLGLIDGILDLSRIEAGKLHPADESFDLAALLDDQAAIYRVRAEEKGVAFRLEVDPSMPDRVRGDSRLLAQVVANLLGNAVKFTARGEICLHASPLSGVEGRCRIEVRDSGIGIPPDRLAQIFEPFSQADPAITREFGGSGLGLSIVNRLVDAMRGRLGVESKPGSGSTFWVELPLPPVSAEASSSSVVGKPQVETARRLPEARLLLVEDSPDNALLVESFLRRQPVTVEVAANGREGVERFQQARYDLILMDIQMPEMDGYEATERIRALEAAEGRAPTPIIALTAHALNEHRERSRACGMDDYLTKPITRERLVEAIAKHLTAS